MSDENQKAWCWGFLFGILFSYVVVVVTTLIVKKLGVG